MAEPQSKTEQIRSALLAGESLSASEAVNRFGGSNGLLTATRKQMEKKGHKFSSEIVDGVTRWKVAEVGQPIKARRSPGTKKRTAKRADKHRTATRSAARNNGNGKAESTRMYAIGDVPVLGEQFTVQALASEPAGVAIHLVGDGRELTIVLPAEV